MVSLEEFEISFAFEEESSVAETLPPPIDERLLSRHLKRENKSMLLKIDSKILNIFHVIILIYECTLFTVFCHHSILTYMIEENGPINFSRAKEVFFKELWLSSTIP